MAIETTATIVKRSTYWVEKELFEQIPLPQPKWLKRAIIDEQEALIEEELYEAGLSDYLDHYAEWSKDDLRMFNNMNDKIRDDIEYPPWPQFKVSGPVYVVEVSPMFISDFEAENPYYAGRYPSRYNPERTNYVEDVNLVQRKFVDGVTRYMGNPTYSQEKDRLLWVDIELLDSKGRYGMIRVKPEVFRELDVLGILDDEHGLYHVLTLYKGYPVFTHKAPSEIPIVIRDDIRPMFDSEGMYQSPVVDEIIYEKHSGRVFETKLHFDDFLADKRPLHKHERMLTRKGWKKVEQLKKQIDRLEHQKQILINQHFRKNMHSKEFFTQRGNEIQERICKYQEQISLITG